MMSFPITSHPVDKYSDMNAVEYSLHSATAHTRQPLVHQDTIFRWPHSNNTSERPLYNCNQYFLEKSVQPRFEFNRYSDGRYPPYEVARSRHDCNVLHENQQKLHEFQKNTSAMRPPSFDSRLQGYDVRPPSYKKSFHDKHDVRQMYDGMSNSYDNVTTSQKLHGQQLDIRPPDQSYCIPPTYPQKLTASAHAGQNHSDGVPSLSSNAANLVPPIITTTTTTTLLAKSGSEILPTNEHPILDKYENNDTLPSNSKANLTSESLKANEMTLDTSHGTPKSINNADEKPTLDRKDILNEDLLKNSKSDTSPPSEKTEGSIGPNGAPKEKDFSDGSSSPDNGLPSYTAMIAQAILRKESNKSTLSDIYEYMEKHFPSLEKRGTGWRNCVRHTLSLNDCFIKLHRPENGRSCNWAVHPSYFESFSRGDYRKRRALRKRPRGLQWIDPIMLGGYPFVREHDMHPNAEQQQSPFYPYPPAPGMWNPQPQQPYPNPNQPSPSHLHHFPQPPVPQHAVIHPSYPPPPPPHPSHAHLHSNHCTNPDCYCQFNKSNFRGGYTP